MEMNVLTDSMVAEGERAAFHGNPKDGLKPLIAARDLCRAAEDYDGAAHCVWLIGVCLASAGHFPDAIDILTPLADALGPKPWSTLADTTIASVLRQQGEHAQAQEHDQRALREADAQTRFDAFIGLAADRVGQGDADGAEENWEAARDVSGDDWRSLVRLAWVEAEIAFMRQDLELAGQLSVAAAMLARENEAPRHQAKSLLFAGVAYLEQGQAQQAEQYLRIASALANELELRSLQAPIAEARDRLQVS